MAIEEGAADQVANMSIKVAESTVSLTAKGAVNLSMLLLAVLKEQKRTKGKVGLQAFQKEATKVLSIGTKDLRLFAREAKRYGIRYHVLMDRRHPDGICDIILSAADAARANRILERFGIAAVSMEERKRDAASESARQTGEVQANPTQAGETPLPQRESRNPSGPSSGNRSSAGKSVSEPEFPDDFSQKRSVREEIGEIQNIFRQNRARSKGRKPKGRGR